MNIWKIDKRTGLPFTPHGYVWKLWFDPGTHTRFPYALHLKREGTNEHWVDAKDRWEIVYASFLNGATGSTIRPRHVRRTAREVLRKHRKIERSKVENQHGSTRVKAGEYPPNVL